MHIPHFLSLCLSLSHYFPQSCPLAPPLPREYIKECNISFSWQLTPELLTPAEQQTRMMPIVDQSGVSKSCTYTWFISILCEHIIVITSTECFQSSHSRIRRSEYSATNVSRNIVLAIVGSQFLKHTRTEARVVGHNLRETIAKRKRRQRSSLKITVSSPVPGTHSHVQIRLQIGVSNKD